MKKTYVKPGIIIENFSLAQNIASGCSVDRNRHFGDPNQASKYTCGWVDNEFGDVIFLEKGPCKTPGITEDTTVEGLCYNAPAAGVSIFGS